jgi:2OG-Fe(II) oxygenase superfamily
VNRYQRLGEGRGQEFKPHFDWFREGAQLRDRLFDGCQRSATALMYLSSLAEGEGGETLFLRDGMVSEYSPGNPNHIKVNPQRGRVLAWYNSHPLTEAIDWKTLHAGLPILSNPPAVKLAATAFIRNCTRSDEVQA